MMMMQDFTIEHTHPEVVAQAVGQAVGWGAFVEGYFVCPTAPVVPRDDVPSHTVVHYRAHHAEPAFAPPPWRHIASVGACMCLGTPPEHHRYQSAEELAEAVLVTLRGADTSNFQSEGREGPFVGTDSWVKVGYRAHYCSWYGRGLWLSFRHIYMGK